MELNHLWHIMGYIVVYNRLAGIKPSVAENEIYCYIYNHLAGIKPSVALNEIYCHIYNRITGISNVALIVPPMVHVFKDLQISGKISILCIIRLAKYTFFVLSVRPNIHSLYYPFDQINILCIIRSAKYTFFVLSVRPNVHSLYYPFDQISFDIISFWASVRRPNVFRSSVISTKRPYVCRPYM